MVIGHFSGKHAFLSNFHPSQIKVGIRYPTVEHYYQAQKTLSMRHRRRIAELPSPGQAKRAGRNLPLRPDWEAIKLDVMLRGIRAKFAHNSRLAAQLLATGDALLVEGNNWDDKYWGALYNLETDRWVGKNWLGGLLMLRRAELRGRS